ARGRGESGTTDRAVRSLAPPGSEPFRWRAVRGRSSTGLHGSRSRRLWAKVDAAHDSCEIGSGREVGHVPCPLTRMGRQAASTYEGQSEKVKRTRRARAVR